MTAFTTGALGAVLLVSALPLGMPSGFGPVESIGAVGAPFLIAAYGAGLLLGPLPMPRLLLRIPAPVILVTTVLLQSVAAILIVITQSFLVALPLLLVLGFTGVSQDSVRSIAIRRLIPPDLFERVSRLMLLALTVGQVYGAIGVVSIGVTVDPFAILVVLAISQVLLVLLGLALGGRAALKIGGLSEPPDHVGCAQVCHGRHVLQARRPASRSRTTPARNALRAGSIGPFRWND